MKYWRVTQIIMMDYKFVARDGFNTPIGLMKRSREEVIYDFFNYALMKEDFDVQEEGYNSTLGFFEEIFREQTEDLYDLGASISQVYTADENENQAGEFYGYLENRKNSMFNKWLKVNSIKFPTGAIPMVRDYNNGNQQ